MGLLDTMDDPQFRLGMGLLAAGSARSDGAGFGQRINEVLGGMDSWKQQQAAQKRAALQEQMYNAQLQEMTLKTAREKQLLEQERAKREGFGQVFKSGLPPLMGDPSIGMLPSAGTAPSIDVARGVQLGYTGPELEAFAKLKNINLEKVARTQEVEGPNGEKLIQQLDDFGRPVGKAMPGYTPAQLVSLGDRSVFAKPQAGLSFTMGQSPDSKASNALGWANNNLASQRLAFDKAGGADAGKPQLVDGQWVYKPTFDAPAGRTVPVAGFQPKPPEAFSKASRQLNDLEGSLAEYRQSLKDNPGMIFGTGATPKGIPIPFTNSTIPFPQGKDSTDLTSKYTSMLMGLKNLYELGALAGPDMQILEGNLTDPATFRGVLSSAGSFEKQVEVVDGMLKRAKRNLNSAYGLKNPQQDIPGKNIGPNNLDPLGLFK